MRVADDATELDDQVQAAIALGDAGGSLMQAGDAERARELTERALAMPGGNDDWRAQQLTNLAAELNALGEPEPAVARLLEAANLASAPENRADALRGAGEGAISSPETAGQAPRIFKLELELRREHESSEHWAWRAAEIGATLSHTSQTSAAPGFFTIALRVFARRADRRQAFFIRNDRASANADFGNLSSALADLTVCLGIAHGMNDGALTQQAHMNLGEVERRKGNHAAAAGHLNRALSIARRLQDARAEGDTLVLLALNVEDDDTRSARATLSRADQLARTLKDRELQARVCKGRAGLEFKAGRFAAAATLYLRTAKMLGGEAFGELAESLGGALLSAARRGRLDEDTLEQLLDVSTRLGEVEALVDELTGALPALAEKGDDRGVARLAAVALGVSAQLMLHTDGDDPKRFVPFMRVRSVVSWWLAAKAVPETVLTEQLHDVCGKEAGREIMKLVGDEVETIRQKREKTGEDESSAALPRAA